ANRLAANGDWREQLNLAWSLEIPALEKFLDGARGAIRFQGTAHGTRKQPQIAGSLSGKQLRYGAWNANELALAGNIDLSDRLVSQLELNASRIGWNDIHMDTLHVNAQGKAAGHTVDIRTTTSKNGAFSKVSTHIDGSYANGSWQARVAPVAFADRDGVAPTAPASQGRFVWSEKQRLAENMCMLWTTHRFCGNGTWSPGGNWSFEAESDELPLNVFNGVSPQVSSFQGSWLVHAKLAGGATTPWPGQATIDVNDASLAYQAIAGAEEIVRLGTGRVEVSANNDRFLASVRIVTPGTTNIDASARVDRNASMEFQNSPLTGDVRVLTGDANLLPLIFPDLDHSAGELTAQLHASGTPAAPLLQGQIDLQKGELDLYRYNLSVRDLGVSARIAENHLVFDGQAKIGDGKLAMNGDYAWSNSKPIGKLHLQGENLLVANLPEYRVSASPNLDFQIEGKHVEARGEVTIPSAHLEPRDLRGAVQTSHDVRLVDEMPEPPLRGFDVRSEVRLRVGQDVQLETYGLQGKLGGSVVIASDSTSAIGRGELNVSEGHYEAYGQKLNIARGRLIFNASPLDNPGLDIQAERKIEDSDTRVGVNVRGTLRDPRVSLFSEPSLPQSQIVSMLLTGKPIADLSSRDAAAVGAAQSDLRLQGGGLLASQIGRRLGLVDVSIESTSLNGTALVLGRFLSPRLFVSYGISLTESINTMKLRYTISDQWFIKTEAGQNQSADVQYRIER
ncbi:MAG TPA: translocation/assembly module TamB domain-containing protein, partial [Steroidobacteraceae bacterium]|nr:translocation/assembly module TamB domain-containing protein [Steroidobacteraceae bacterium]